MRKIIYGNGNLHLETMSEPDVKITSIHIDNFNHICIITREIGLDVKQFNISIEHAQKIGFINLDALNDYL